MKKTVVTLVMGIVMASGIQAENIYDDNDRAWFNNSTFSKVKVGAGIDESNFYAGMDWMTPSQHGFSFGLGADYLNYEASTRPTQSYGSVYTLGAELKVGYDLREITKGYIPVQLKAGYGYGLARLDTVNEWGANYSIAAETNIYKGFGVGVAHHWQDTDVINFDDTVIYFSLAY